MPFPAISSFLQQLLGADDCLEREVIQSLWSGYGEIVRVELIGARADTVVVKHIQLQRAGAHPRGWDTNQSHQRKVESYEVENKWYLNWSSRCSSQCKVPAFLGAIEENGDRFIVMEDLAIEYPLVEQEISYHQVETCLAWLAHFHATFILEKPVGLWPIGTYWHLATRSDEWKRMEEGELKVKAAAIDHKLNDCRFQTFVHGDAKIANFCFSEDRSKVAAVDFQYVGGGCGIKDVVYFLGSCLSAEENELYEDALLDYYFDVLKEALDKRPIAIDVAAVEEEWRSLYAFASTDFLRFLLGWMPGHHKINRYNQALMHEVLADV